ncbi:hypothetical protein LOD99_1213 [Oopsacas minuta]|uniref:SAM domain-containing protein n=1 Tax=Oopsacas minuta TaxID=111878 RepID=A0AAV7K5C6_9METZ|nr:hypothetical protein LOD99_1213 [Oopsacas minuta]
MDIISKFPKPKRSSSCSELGSTEIVYDIMSSDDENDKHKNGSESEGSIIYDIVSSGEENEEGKQDDKTHELPESPCLPPRAKDPIPIKKKPPKVWDLEALDTDRSVKFPLIIEVSEGMYSDNEKNSYYTEDQLLICSKPITSFVTCVTSKEQVFNIQIHPSYEIALVNMDSELNNKTNESVKNILAMRSAPNRIVSNSQFEIDGVTIGEGQILEMTEFVAPNDKCLRVQTLSGEDIKLPKNLKNTFSCSISGRSIILPLAIESCVFPQRVVLTDNTVIGRTRKMLCTILECFTKTAFLACRYKNDVQASLTSESVLVELPLNLGISFTIIGMPNDKEKVFKILEIYSKKKSVTIGKSNMPEIPALPALPSARRPLRSNSVTDLRHVNRPQSLQQIAKPQLPFSPQPQRVSNFFQRSKDYDRCRTPPPVTSKPNKALKIKLGKGDLLKELRKNTAENIANMKDIKSSEPGNEVLRKEMTELITENKILKERVDYLENSLSQKKREFIELENTLNEANSTIKDQNNTIIKMGIQQRTLPSIPGTGSAPNSPLMQGRELPNRLKLPLMSPPPLTTKPKIAQEDYYKNSRDLSPTKLRPPEEEPHYKSPRDIFEPKSTNFNFEIKLDTQTAEYLGQVLDRSNLGQYMNVFLEEGINTDVFTELNEQILEEELGVKNALHRKKLMKLAEKMKRNEDISHFFVDPQYMSGYRDEKIYEKLS